MSQILLNPTLDESSVDAARWCVVIFNNDHTPYETVITILMVATKCTEEEAEIETWEAHHFGKAQVHFGSQVVCEEVAEIIRSVGVRAEVQPEWND